MSDEQSELAAARARVAELEAKAAAAATPTASGPGALVTGRSKGLSARSIAWLGIGAAVVGVLVTYNQVRSRQEEPAAAVKSDWKAEAAAVQPIGSASPTDADGLWRYGVVPDPIRGKLGTMACVDSTDEVRLDWPYKAQNIELCVRRSARYGLDVFIRMPQGGQYICRAYGGCAVQVRFDDGKPIRFAAAGADDSSSDVLFLQRAESFLSQVKTAKVTRIEAQYFEAGNQVSTFPTDRFHAEQLTVRNAE
jgi:hypothetical protein